MTRVYIIAAYSAAPAVRAIHDRLRMAGIEPVSSWAEEAHGPEALDGLSDDECYRIWDRNRRDLDSASVALVLADTPMREGHAEAAHAMRTGCRVVWVGRPTLGARADSVFGSNGPWFVATVDDALAGLEGMVSRG